MLSWSRLHFATWFEVLPREAQERLRDHLGADLRSLRSGAERLKASLPGLDEKNEAHRSAQELLKQIEAVASHYQL